MTELNSKIVEVTVYNDRARVTRRGAMHLETGANRLSITNLPLTLNPEFGARLSAREYPGASAWPGNRARLFH